MFDKIEYLVKRLKQIGCEVLLETDNDYMNAIYAKLPVFDQQAWDRYETADFDGEWVAFQSFLKEIYMAALKKRTRMESIKVTRAGQSDKHGQETMKPRTYQFQGKCLGCGESGHKIVDCPHKVNQRVSIAGVGTSADNASQDSSCPCCKETHQFVDRSGTTRPTKRLANCPKYRLKTARERGLMIENMGGCIICTDPRHIKADCRLLNTQYAECGEDMAGGVKCQENHNRLLHGSGVAYCARTEVVGQEDKIDTTEGTLMLCQDIPVGKELARVQWDNGSSRVMITHSFAKKAGLGSRPIKYWLQVVGQGWEEVEKCICLN